METGFRSREVRELTWGDVDLDGDPPTLSVTIKRAKNRKPYDQPINENLAKKLTALRKQRADPLPARPPLSRVRL